MDTPSPITPRLSTQIIKMKYNLQAVLILLMILLLVSCATPPVTNDQIQTIERGMDYDRFKSMIVREPVSSFDLQYKGFSYLVYIYPMQTGTEVAYSYYSTKYYSRVVAHTYSVSEDYLFIFDKGGLIFWGFVNEFHKEDDKLIQQLAPLISEKYEREKYLR